MSDTAATVKEFILAEFLPGTHIDELNSSYDLLDTGVVDSLGLLRLITWVGKTYHIPVDEIEISPENFQSVDAICNFIEHATKA